MRETPCTGVSGNVFADTYYAVRFYVLLLLKSSRYKGLALLKLARVQPEFPFAHHEEA